MIFSDFIIADIYPYCFDPSLKFSEGFPNEDSHRQQRKIN